VEVRERYIRTIRYYNETLIDIEEKAEERGEKKAKIDAAKNLLKAGIEVDTIAASIGLSISEIESLREE
jgi:predicted transposase/invertase (TIGR01784 family)